MNISSKTQKINFRKSLYFSGKKHVKILKNKHNRLKIAKINLRLTHETPRNLTNVTLPGASISLNRFLDVVFFVIFSLILNFFRMSTYYLSAQNYIENDGDCVFCDENKNKKYSDLARTKLG